MANEGICKEFLEKLLHIEIAELEIAKSEWTEDVYYDAKAVRFDIFVRDSSGQIYDIEMQAAGAVQSSWNVLVAENF